MTDDHRGARIAFLICFVFALAIVYGTGATNGMIGRLDDPDSLTRGYLAQLLMNGQWFDHTLPAVDPPRGVVTHWTSPMSVLVAMGAYPLSFFMHPADAVNVWGIFLSPLMIAGLLGAAYWAARALGDARVGIVAMFAVASTEYVRHRYIPGIIDHSSILYILWILQIGYALRLLRAPEERCHHWPAGLVFAFAMLVSVEMILALFPLLLGLGLSWLFGRREAARAGSVFSVSLCAGILGLLMIEYGPYLTHQAWNESDTLSLFFLALLLPLVPGFYALHRFSPERFVGRLALAGLAGLAVLLGSVLVAYLTQPQLVLTGNAHDLDDIYRETRSLHIRESAAILNLRRLSANGIDNLRTLVDVMPMTLVALPILLGFFALAVRRRDLATLASIVMVVGIFAILTRGYGAVVMRAVPFFELTSFVVVALAAGRLLACAAPGGKALHTAIACLVVLSMNLVTVQTERDFRKTRTDEAVVDPVSGRPLLGFCHIDDAIAHLRHIEPARSSSDIVLAHPDVSSFLLQWTDYSVLSIPIHRLQPGFRFKYDFYHETSTERAHAMLVERGVSHVLFCGRGSYIGLEGRLTDGDTIGRLMDTVGVNFLEQIALPEGVQQARLFRVKPLQ